ncbi:hypothetical protein [Serratia sp. AKBS12]|uniref:hypothetical protein n=1 Tax=Serratia sp. AKBS12 TaxID=2974597 RepID=UPI00216657B2|nr:hypothetical protein [Serratia sp. AKBS12]MCS3407324.1 hypothetical protein [Serratia sp. AKBS12]HEI8868443.1 hypothetical protein [Serratia odorifera]
MKKNPETKKQSRWPANGKAKIPPSWQLNEAQRSFIEDLWQDDALNTPTPDPARAPD